MESKTLIRFLFRFLVRSLWRRSNGLVVYIYELFSLFYESMRSLVTEGERGGRSAFGVAVIQILFTGVEALLMVSVIALLIGVIIIIQSFTHMPRVGVGDYFGKVLVMVVFRELGPLLTALIVIGRSGSAIATYQGNMKVSQEIEALEVMGINPVRYLVTPTIIAAVISMVCLTMYFNIISILGGYLISSLKIEMPITVFLQFVLNALTVTDILISLLKSIIFGIIVSVVACYHGLSVKISFQEVPQQTLRAVMNSIIMAVILNSGITLLFYI